MAGMDVDSQSSTLSGNILLSASVTPAPPTQSLKRSRDDDSEQPDSRRSRKSDSQPTPTQNISFIDISDFLTKDSNTEYHYLGTKGATVMDIRELTAYFSSRWRSFVPGSVSVHGSTVLAAFECDKDRDAAVARLPAGFGTFDADITADSVYRDATKAAGAEYSVYGSLLAPRADTAVLSLEDARSYARDLPAQPVDIKIGEYKPKPSDKNAGSFARFAIFFFESLSDFEACNNRLILYHSLATPDASDDVFLQHPNMEIVPSKCRIGKADVIRMRIWGIPARSRNDRLQAMFKFVGIPSLHSAVLPTTKDQACSAFFWVPGAAKDTTLQFSGKLMLNNRPLRIYPAQFYQ
eukprot:gnl/Hemi2/13293_TR4561_c0_g1_i1.p1 gnl/Hemi2/13293_TR4561_c0_g1~~gnl/Hemi2/13293_TR4561_c0_g1_i1.p1  ORF type:complete len:380 (-),score=61.76 gnl/Hemi2/13293_TR4561_c0_g1_i1:104-1156(-)